VQQLLQIESSSVHLKIGRAVLAGDTGVGKSGLSLVLAGQEFRATESTHGRQITPVRRTTVKGSDGCLEVRELLLWDLAGQPGYRLIHQMALIRAETVIIVFDARSQTDPFSGVRYWVRAAQQAEQSAQRAYPVVRFLVSARTDRGGISASPRSPQQIMASGGFSAYYETSSKVGHSIDELREAVWRSVNWQALPPITSTQLFLEIRDFMVQEARSGTSIALIGALQHSFENTQVRAHAAVLDKRLFVSWLAGVEAHGVLRLLGFGDLVLLKPELLDAYASALVIAAGNAESGIGALVEEEVLAGSFVPDEEFRLADREQERLLLLATLDEMLRAELVLREPSDEGVFLVVPSEMRLSGPAAAVEVAGATRFRFEGPTQNIYSTLIVRLAHCGLYDKVDMWAGGAQFRSRNKGIANIQFSQPEEGVGSVELRFDKALTRDARLGLESYVQRHLWRHAIDGSVSMDRSITCPGAEHRSVTTK